MPHDLPENTELWQTHIENTEKEEVELLLDVKIDNPEPDWSATGKWDSRILALSEGGPIEGEPGRPISFQGEEGLFRAVIKDRALAYGYYLYGMETHGLPEDVIAAVNEEVDLSPYFEMQEDLTPRTRRLRLMDLLEERVDNGDWLAEMYLDTATWRDTNLSESGEALARRIASNVEPEPRLCYYTAGESAIHELENHRVEYVEGIALPKQACQAIRHAWVEIDGSVAELTWPWHQYDGAEAVYLGTSVDKAEVRQQRRERDWNGPIIADEDEMQEFYEALPGASMG